MAQVTVRDVAIGRFNFYQQENLNVSVFISWSGDDDSYGAQIGTALKRALVGVFSGVHVYHSRHDRTSGPWYSELEDELRASRVCICVLTRQALTSLWMPFEVGEIKAAGGKRENHILPVLFGIKEHDIKGPFKQENYFRFSYESFFKIVLDVNQVLELNVREIDLTNACGSLWGALERTVDLILNEMEIEDEAKRPQETILSFVTDYLAQHVSQKVFDKYLRDYLLGLGNDELAPILAGISRDMDACIELASGADHESDWNGVWLKYAFENLVELSTRLNRIARGEIPMTSPEDGRNFWKNVIMEQAASVKATNIASFGANFGRRSDSVLLDAQRKAIGSGVSITRVFICRLRGGEGTSKEHTHLRSLMEEQIEAGIKVYVISEEEFYTRKRGLVDRIGGSDFMILDEKYLYLTKYDDSGSEITGTEFLKDPFRVSQAMMLFKVILEYARPVNADQAKRFPNIS